jgi:hypothetical protein
MSGCSPQTRQRGRGLRRCLRARPRSRAGGRLRFGAPVVRGTPRSGLVDPPVVAGRPSAQLPACSSG